MVLRCRMACMDLAVEAGQEVEMESASVPPLPTSRWAQTPQPKQ